MDAKILEIDNLLQQHYETHPHTIKLWKEYLNIRLEKFNSAIDECHVLIDKINNGYPDLSPEQVAILQQVYNS